MDERVRHAIAAAVLLAALVPLMLSVLERRAPRTVPLLALLRDYYPPLARPATVLPLAVVAGVVAAASSPVAAWTFGWVAWHGRSLSPPLAGWAAVSLAIAFLLAAVEEIIFRGALLEQLGRRMPLVAAVGLSAVLFSLAHLSRSRGYTPTPVSLAVYLVDGACFAVVFLGTRTLWTPTVWHAAKNACIWIVFGTGSVRLAPGLVTLTDIRPTAWTGAPDQAGAIDLAVALALLGAALVLLRRPLAAISWCRP